MYPYLTVGVAHTISKISESTDSDLEQPKSSVDTIAESALPALEELNVDSTAAAPSPADVKG